MGAPGLGRDDVIEGREGEIGIAHLAALGLDDAKPAAAAVMHQMATDVQQRVVVTEIGDDMAIPDLVEQGLSRHGVSFPARALPRAGRTPSFFGVGYNGAAAERKTAARLIAGSAPLRGAHKLCDRQDAPQSGALLAKTTTADGSRFTATLEVRAPRLLLLLRLPRRSSPSSRRRRTRRRPCGWCSRRCRG